MLLGCGWGVPSCVRRDAGPGVSTVRCSGAPPDPWRCWGGAASRPGLCFASLQGLFDPHCIPYLGKACAIGVLQATTLVQAEV